VSFGQISFALAREAYKLGHSPNIIPIGNVDISAQREDPDFTLWLQSCISKGLKTHKRKNPCFRLWHISDSLQTISDKQVLLTFFETDSPTTEELNIISNNYKVLFACDYNTNTFKDYGATNVSTLNLGFDSFNFYKTDREYFNDGRITYLVSGKYEPVRKQHDKIIKTWLRKFGNNNKYHLICCIQNPFIHPEQHNQIYANILEGKNYSNIQFLPFSAQNSVYNDILNSVDCVIAGGTESWGLPEFQAVCLGKHGVISNCAGHKQWADEKNSILLNSNSRIQCYDGMFFHKGQPFNQGNFFSFSESELSNCLDTSIKKIEENRVNTKGLELSEKFKYSETFRNIHNLLIS